MQLGSKGYQFSCYGSLSLLFADIVVLLASVNQDLQLALGWSMKRLEWVSAPQSQMQIPCVFGYLWGRDQTVAMWSICVSNTYPPMSHGGKCKIWSNWNVLFCFIAWIEEEMLQYPLHNTRRKWGSFQKEAQGLHVGWTMVPFKLTSLFPYGVCKVISCKLVGFKMVSLLLKVNDKR